MRFTYSESGEPTAVDHLIVALGGEGFLPDEQFVVGEDLQGADPAVLAAIPDEEAYGNGYIPITINDEVFWLVLVHEGEMHAVEEVLSTR